MTTTTVENLPKPQCRMGYTNEQIQEILGDRLEEFNSWMIGQTWSICNGRAYNHETRQYEVACDGVSHGDIIYRDDVERFLKGLPIID